MTREEFIQILDKKGYSYEIEGDKIVVDKRKGNIILDSLKTLPSGVVFNNGGGVYLKSLTSIPPGVVFRNKGDVRLYALTSIPPGVEFKNGGHVNLDSLIGGRFFEWKGNIKGIEPKVLLNGMIKKGVFI